MIINLIEKSILTIKINLSLVIQRIIEPKSKVCTTDYFNEKGKAF